MSSRGLPASLGAIPTFSVVIPAYQASHTIADAVESVLVQTRPAHEILVVDDGSTDDLARAVAPFGDRIRLIRKDNGGAASAVNLGAAHATGDFLARLDADDAYRPRMLEALGELSSRGPKLDLLTSDAHLVYQGVVVARYGDRVPFPQRSQRVAILRSCFPGGWAAVRLSRFRQIGGLDESLRTGEDWDCWIRLILDGAEVGWVGEPLLEYRLRSGSLTSDRLGSLRDRIRVLENAASNRSLREGERPALSDSLRYHRTRAVLAEAKDVTSRQQAPRARLICLAASRGIAVRARLRVALAATAPHLAGRWLPTDAGSLRDRFARSAGSSLEGFG